MTSLDLPVPASCLATPQDPASTKPPSSPPGWSHPGRGCRTIDALVEEEEELIDSHLHLSLAQVQQRDHLEVELAEEGAEGVHVHHGSLQLLVVQVVHVADQQGHFVGGCQDGRRRRWGRCGTLLLSLLPSAHRGDTQLWLVSLSPSTRVPHGAPWPSGALWGDTGDGHNPTGPPTPPGQALTIQLARATTLRGA